jgi:hypothetical protein
MGIGEEIGIVKRPRASVARRSCRWEGVRSAIVMRRKAKGARELGENEGRWKEGTINGQEERVDMVRLGTGDAMPEAGTVNRSA